MQAVPRKLSIFLLIVVLAICVYRARIQFFTVDEAFVFNLFVNHKLEEMARNYDACNHILHTFLMKLSAHYLGKGELALRVPGLIGALLYCIAVFRLTSLTLGGWAQLLAIALLTLHPLVLDLLIAARGYGLALALFLWALYFTFIYYLRGLKIRALWIAGLLAGLSIGTNLIMLIPAAALGFVLLIPAIRRGMHRGWEVIDAYGGPALVTAFVIVVIPILPARAENFYYGETSVSGFVESLVSSIVKVPDRWPGPSMDLWMPVATVLLVPLGTLALVIGVVRTGVKALRGATLPYRLIPFLLTGGTLLISLALIFALHAAFGIKYPRGRTGLFLLPLFFLASLFGLRLLESGVWRPARIIGYGLGYGLAALLVFTSLIQTDNHYFSEWQWDAGTGILLRRMHEDFAKVVQPGQEPARLGTSLFIDQTVRYYRVRRGLDWLAEPETSNLESKPYDYYLLTPNDFPLVGRLGLQVISREAVSGEVLARRAPRRDE